MIVKKKSKSIVYLPTPERSNLSEQNCFEIPNDLFLPPFVIKELRSGEFFLEDIKKQLGIEFPDDFLIIIPPFQGCNSLSNTLKVAHPGHSLEAICLREVIFLLPIQKSLGIILPNHLFTNTSNPEIIQEIVKELDIDYFIEFDNSSAFFNNIHKSFRFTLVIFSKKRNDQSFTKFFKVPSFVEGIDSESLLKDFSRLLKQGGGKTNYGYVHRDKIKPESLISYDNYHPDFLKKLADINTYGEVRKLKDICSIMVGCKRFSQNRSNVTSQESLDIPLVQGRSILLTGNLDPEFLESNAIKISIQGSNLKYLRDGDLCIRRVTNYSDNLRCLVFAEITEEVLPLIASDSVLVLRFNENLEKEERDLTIAYLRSHFTDTWLKIYASRLSSAIRLTPHLLGELPVPCFDVDLKTSFRGLTNAIKDFNTWKQSAEKARNSIFDFETAQDSRLYLLATGRETKKRHEAAKLVDDFNYRIRTQFPHPIAYRWRTVLSSYPDLEGYKGVLRCAEALTCYLAHIAILFAEYQGTPIQHLKTIAKNLY